MPPITINYRYYKDFDISYFRNDVVKQNLETFDKKSMTYEDFENIFMSVLKWYVPMKKMVKRGNNQPFMNRALSKEMMHRSKLKNSFNKNPTKEKAKKLLRVFTKKTEKVITII